MLSQHLYRGGGIVCLSRCVMSYYWAVADKAKVARLKIMICLHAKRRWMMAASHCDDPRNFVGDHKAMPFRARRESVTKRQIMSARLKPKTAQFSPNLIFECFKYLFFCCSIYIFTLNALEFVYKRLGTY